MCVYVKSCWVGGGSEFPHITLLTFLIARARNMATSIGKGNSWFIMYIMYIYIDIYRKRGREMAVTRPKEDDHNPACWSHGDDDA